MSWRASARVEGSDPEREMAFAGQLEARRPDGTPPRISTGEIEAMEARPFHMTASTPMGSAERLEYERGSKNGGANAVRSP
jgi:hypothetical protein